MADQSETTRPEVGRRFPPLWAVLPRRSPWRSPLLRRYPHMDVGWFERALIGRRKRAAT